jgi:hypothetical protein
MSATTVAVKFGPISRLLKNPLLRREGIGFNRLSD